MVRTVDCFGLVDAEQWKRLVAWLVSLERIAIVAGESTSPVVFELGPDSGLEGEASLDRSYH